MIMAKSSIRNPMLKYFCKFMKIIPTERPNDKKYKGKGKIVDLKNGIMKGQDTKFTSLHIKDTIRIDKDEFLIIEILNDT